MSYQILYYTDATMRHPSAGSDTVADIDRYPAPTSGFAYARNSNGFDHASGSGGVWRHDPGGKYLDDMQEISRQQAEERRLATAEKTATHIPLGG